MITYAVTGANGYLGAALTKRLRERGARVIELSRRPDSTRPDTAAYSLEGGGDLASCNGANVLVHCAYDFSVRSARDIHARNVQGSSRLFDTAQRAGIERIVFISSMSAFDGCQSLYGQAKLAIEQDVSRRGGEIVRPGLIFAHTLGGMMGSLERAVLASRVLPVPTGGSQRLFLVHEADVAEIVHRLAKTGQATPSTPVVAAHRAPWFLRDVLKTIAHGRDRSPWVIGVPWRLMWVGLKAIESLGVPLRMRSDSVVSLVNQDPTPSFASLDALGVSCREFSTAREG